MPYYLHGKCVVKKLPSGVYETVKCHKTPAKALAHFRALKVNVDLKEKALRVFKNLKNQFDK